jgi:hypothetical protein
MSRLFLSTKEIRFFNSLNKELIQKIVAQKIIYYSVSEEHTQVNDLYKESINKTVYVPVEINARVLYNEPQQTTGQFTIDTKYSIEVYFHMDELEERKIIAREGDFLKFGTVVYEIQKLTRPQITYGLIEQEVMTKAECIVSRKSNFEVLDNIPGY